MKTNWQILACLWLLAAACSSTSKALPQASIPAPTGCEGDDCITVSNPDSDGRLTITANAGAVPDDAVVIISAEATETSWLDRATGIFCGKALAQASCTSDIPSCSDIDGELTMSCQLNAEADGSFAIQLIIDTEREVRISYLEPGSCEEVEKIRTFIEDLIASGLYNISIEGHVMVSDGVSLLYIFGATPEGNRLLTVDITEETPDFSTVGELAINGTPRSMTYFESDGAGSLVLMTDEETGLVPSGGGGELSIVTESESQTAEVALLEAHEAFFQADFDYTAFDIASCNGARPFEGATDRILFIREAS
ncbi:MAG: hypothetical protein Q7T11_06325, partial [Deltaproteobacteria bacterium]|nr:hypothetical protein [Deltaproteobacteria bacterium]